MNELKTRFIDHLWRQHRGFSQLKGILGNIGVVCTFSKREITDTLIYYALFRKSITCDERVFRVDLKIDPRAKSCILPGCYNAEIYPLRRKSWRRSVQDDRVDNGVVINVA